MYFCRLKTEIMYLSFQKRLKSKNPKIRRYFFECLI